jgi:putative Holliday junction resolvase
VRVLGIDLGSKRVGVAVSDRSGTIATPLCVLERGASQRLDHNEIARLVQEEDAVAVVVGLPLNMDGSAGKAADAALREVERMTTVVGVPVYVISILLPSNVTTNVTVSIVAPDKLNEPISAGTTLV